MKTAISTVALALMLATGAWANSSNQTLEPILTLNFNGFRVEFGTLVFAGGLVPPMGPCLSVTPTENTFYDWATTLPGSNTAGCSTANYGVNNNTAMTTAISGILDCNGESSGVYYECVAIAQDANGKQIWGANFYNVNDHSVFVQTPSVTFTPPITVTLYGFNVDDPSSSTYPGYQEVAVYVGGERLEQEVIETYVNNNSTNCTDISGKISEVNAYSWGYVGPPYQVPKNCTLTTYPASDFPSGAIKAGPVEGNLQCRQYNSAPFECEAKLIDNNGLVIWSTSIHHGTNVTYQTVQTEDYVPSTESWTPPLHLYIYEFPDNAPGRPLIAAAPRAEAQLRTFDLDPLSHGLHR